MLILIQLPGKLTYNKIGLTKVLKYNFADIVTGILPKNHFYGSYLGFCVLSNFFGTLRQTPIRQTRQSDKHKRKSGRQENPTNSGQRQSVKQDNLRGLVVPYQGRTGSCNLCAPLSRPCTIKSNMYQIVPCTIIIHIIQV